MCKNCGWSRHQRWSWLAKGLVCLLARSLGLSKRRKTHTVREMHVWKQAQIYSAWLSPSQSVCVCLREKDASLSAMTQEPLLRPPRANIRKGFRLVGIRERETERKKERWSPFLHGVSLSWTSQLAGLIRGRSQISSALPPAARSM